jgi:hypothetical protein
MSSFLSAISGNFSKSFIQGVFAPVALFEIFGLIILGPLLPVEVPLFQPLAALDPGWKLLAITLVGIVLSLMLYSLNYAIIRLYEGYPWQKSWLGQLRTRFYKDEAASLNRKSSAVLNLVHLIDKINEQITSKDAHLKEAAKENRTRAVEYWKSLPEVRQAKPDLDQNGADNQEEEEWQAVERQVRLEFARLQKMLAVSYPADSELILPTRLGNIIRNFEYYAYAQYHMDPIILWPRLVGAMDASYQGSVDDAKTQFDFMLNCSLLSALLAFLIGLSGLLSPLPGASLGQLLGWLFQVALFLFLAWWFYQQTFDAATNWGDRVRSAFDLYKDALRKKLGYTQTISERSQEKELWFNISQQMYYGDTESGEPPSYSDPVVPPLTVSTDPPETITTITRGFSRRLPDGTIEIRLQVVNTTPVETTLPSKITRLVINDTLPVGWLYLWHSARANMGALSLSGSTKLAFTLDNLALDSGAAVQILYQISPQAIPEKKEVA